MPDCRAWRRLDPRRVRFASRVSHLAAVSRRGSTPGALRQTVVMTARLFVSPPGPSRTRDVRGLGVSPAHGGSGRRRGASKAGGSCIRTRRAGHCRVNGRSSAAVRGRGRRVWGKEALMSRFRGPRRVPVNALRATGKLAVATSRLAAVLGAGVTIAMPFATASTADAATYSVWACANGSGAPLGVGSWVRSASAGLTDVQTTCGEPAVPVGALYARARAVSSGSSGRRRVGRRRRQGNADHEPRRLVDLAGDIRAALSASTRWGAPSSTPPASLTLSTARDGAAATAPSSTSRPARSACRRRPVPASRSPSSITSRSRSFAGSTDAASRSPAWGPCASAAAVPASPSPSSRPIASRRSSRTRRRLQARLTDCAMGYGSVRARRSTSRPQTPAAACAS